MGTSSSSIHLRIPQQTPDSPLSLDWLGSYANQWTCGKISAIQTITDQGQQGLVCGRQPGLSRGRVVVEARVMAAGGG